MPCYIFVLVSLNFHTLAQNQTNHFGINIIEQIQLVRNVSCLIFYKC